MPSIKRLQHTSVPMPPGGEEQARNFYGSVLGMREIPKPVGLQDKNLVWFAASDAGDEIHVFQELNMGPNSAEQHVCLEVDDLDAYFRNLEAGGYEPRTPESIHNRPRLFVRDPFGNLVELVQILGQYT